MHYMQPRQRQHLGKYYESMKRYPQRANEANGPCPGIQTGNWSLVRIRDGLPGRGDFGVKGRGNCTHRDPWWQQNMVKA